MLPDEAAEVHIVLVVYCLSHVRKPSICSKRSGLILEPRGSSIKSIPSRRASFAAGTKVAIAGY